MVARRDHDEVVDAQCHAAGEKRFVRQVSVVTADCGKQHALTLELREKCLINEMAEAGTLGEELNSTEPILADHSTPHHAVQVGHQYFLWLGRGLRRPGNDRLSDN